jgi:hypothetical protein
VEPAHEWKGEVVARVDDPERVAQMLAKGSAAAREGTATSGAPEPALTLTGPHPSEAWVYSTLVPSKVRVLWFVDEDGDGTYRLVRDDLADANASVSEVAATELPPDLYAQVGTGERFDPLPVLALDAVKPSVSTASFKAHEAKTFVRFTVAVRPDDVDIELGAKPEEFLAGAEVWLQVEQDGTPIFQRTLRLREHPPVDSDGSKLVGVGVPLLPGAYTYTAMLVGSDRRGGKASGELQVPSFSGGLALSSTVLAKADKSSGEPKLPKAAATAPGDEASPFAIGGLEAVPQVSGSFRQGDAFALVTEAYNGKSVVLEYSLYREGGLQFSFENEPLELPGRNTQFFEVTPEWSPGSYKVVITATDPADKKTAVEQEVPFRIRG